MSHLIHLEVAARVPRWWMGERMGAGRDAEAFVRLVREAADIGELTGYLSAVAHELGFACVTMVHHVNLAAPPGRAIAYSDYPVDYLSKSLQRRYFADDPVLVACERSAAPFEWSDLPELVAINSRQLEILEVARGCGLEQGFTVPVNVPGEPPGSCSFGLRADRRLQSEVGQAATWVALFSFESARRLLGFAQESRPRPQLSPRQLDCIVLAGRGKSDWAIGQILGISRLTVAEHIAIARQRYGVATRQQLLACCLAEGQVSYADVIL